MSTPELSGVKAERHAERALFRALFDDAAVFPPGLAPLSRAVTDHVARQSSSYADLVGPLLLPAAAVEDLVKLEPLERLPPDERLQVALVGRPGADFALFDDALSLLDGDTHVTVAGIEIGWSPDWRRALSRAFGAGLNRESAGVKSPGAESTGTLWSIEVPRGAEMQGALSDIKRQADDLTSVQAKFRTGSTPEQQAPTSTELAIFIRACIEHDLSFKLTGGLHHAISATTSAGEDQLGFLNVIAATRTALAHGDGVSQLDSTLSQRHPVPILDIITRMSSSDASVLRAFFTSYGCCGVMDPIGDLAAFGLIKEGTV